MSLLPVLKIDEHRKSNRSDCTIRLPQKLGSYSVKNTSEGKEYNEGEAQLRILKLPAKLKPVSYDLTDGYVRMRDGGGLICSALDNEPGLKHLLRWISNNKSKFQLQSGIPSTCLLNTDFISYRGIFTHIMSSPYENRDGWCIAATKFKGTIYLYEFMTDKKREQELNRDEKSNMFSYGGFRFEYYITEPADPTAGESRLDFEKHDEYCCVARSRLGTYSLAYGAEMDCIGKREQVSDPALADFHEIKTTRRVDNQRQWDNLVKFKMFKWWCQCYLIGTPDVICGYRDDDMVVREIEVLRVSEIPKMATKFWSPSVCLRFLERFLYFVKQVVTDDDPGVMFEFNWEPGRDVTVKKVPVTSTRFVIPEWYITSLSN